MLGQSRVKALAQCRDRIALRLAFVESEDFGSFGFEFVGLSRQLERVGLERWNSRYSKANTTTLARICFVVHTDMTRGYVSGSDLIPL